MKLRLKLLKWQAGRPVAILHKNLAEKSSIHVDDRIIISNNGKKIDAVVDIASGLLKENEIIISSEIEDELKLKNKAQVNIRTAKHPESLSFIEKKLACKTLNFSELKEIMKDIVENNLTESEIAYFISAVYKCGMKMKEIENMIKAIVITGEQLNLKGKIVDKHSCGGIPGRTTPIIVSIIAASGLTIPKTSSRAITSPSGTADAMETICKVDFSIKEIKKIIKKTNACIVWGGSLHLAPADDKIIQVERLINIDPNAQLLASILAKKLSVNAKYILIDIPYGKNAKFSEKEAKILEKQFLYLAKKFHLHLQCFLQQTNEPLGNGIGPSLEIKDVIKVLKRESSCHKLEEKSLELAGKLLELAGKAGKNKGYGLAKQILNSKLAYKKFIQIIKAQKGNINKIKEAKFKKDIFSQKSGKIKEIKIKELNNIARILGCPADKESGLFLHKHLNNKIKKGEKLLTLYSNSKEELNEGIIQCKKTKPLYII